MSTSGGFRPQFRTDLVAEPIEEAGKRYIDVVDPDTGSMFRFYEVEYSIACAMDGQRDVGGITAWAKEELGITPSHDEIADVIATLGDLGYLTKLPDVAPTRGVELKAGVVAAPRAAMAAAPAEDVELGAAGSSAVVEQAPVSAGASFELGHMEAKAKATPAPAAAKPAAAPAAAKPVAKPEPVPAMPAPAPVPAAAATPAPAPVAAQSDSLDLLDHAPIRAADVKEAVRASKEMKAVDVPADLLGQLEGKEKSAAEAAESAKRAAREVAEAPRVAPPVETRPRAVELPVVATRAVATPPIGTPVAAVAARPVVREVEVPRYEAPEMPEMPAAESASTGIGVGAILGITFAVLVALGGIGYVLAVTVLEEPDAIVDKYVPPTGSGALQQAPSKPFATLSAVPAQAELTGPVGAVVASAASVGDVVKHGQVVMTLEGYDALAAKLGEGKTTGLIHEVNVALPAAIKENSDASTNERDKVKVEELAKKGLELKARLDAAKKEKAEAEAAMSKLVLRAPFPGTVSASTAKGKTIGEGAPAVVIQTQPALTATYRIVPADRPKMPAVGDVIPAVEKDKPAKKGQCTVMQFLPPNVVTVSCPIVENGLEAKTDVIFE